MGGQFFTKIKNAFSSTSTNKKEIPTTTVTPPTPQTEQPDTMAPTTTQVEAPAFDPQSVKVVFVLGGPGAGKGTQCQKLVKDLGFVHLSATTAGDLLRAEQDTEGSPYGTMIREHIKEGIIVPMEVTIKLLENAMRLALSKRAKTEGESYFLIDGFPRQMDQAVKFDESVCPSSLILFLVCPEDELLKRLLKRGETSGRDDDNVESIKKRFQTFIKTSMPVVDYYRQQGKVVDINSAQEIDTVYADITKGLQPVLSEDLIELPHCRHLGDPMPPPTYFSPQLHQRVMTEDEEEGTHYHYLEPINTSLECAICRNPFVEPAMAPNCQHIFCTHCILRALESSLTCPIDRSSLKVEDLVEAPRIIQSLVQELRVSCVNRGEGCGFEGERGLLEGHLKGECRIVREKAAKKRVAKGKGRAVEDVITRCSLCDTVLHSQSLHNHATTCGAVPITCKYCSTSLLRSQLPSHLLVCPLIPIPCPHSSLGCQTRIPRSLMQEDHLEVSCAFEPLKEFFESNEERIGKLEDENDFLRNRCEKLEGDMKEVRDLLRGVKSGMGSFWMPAGPEDGATTKKKKVATEVTPAFLRRESKSFVDAPTSPPIPQTSDAYNFDPFFDAVDTLDEEPRTSVAPIITARSSSLPAPSIVVPVLPRSTITSRPLFPRESNTLWVGAPPVLPAETESISTIISTLRSNVSTLSNELSALDGRQQTALMNETRLIQEDVQSVRAGLHGVRMQLHYVLMEVGRLTGSTTNGGGGGMMGMRTEAVGGIGLMGNSSGSSDGAESNSDDDQLTAEQVLFRHHPMGTMGMGGQQTRGRGPFPIRPMGGFVGMRSPSFGGGMKL